MKGIAAIAAGLTLIYGAARAAPVDPAQLRAAAEAAVQRAAGKTPGVVAVAAPLDPRLQLNACNSAPQGFIAGDGQLHDSTTVGVRCDAPVRWTIYIRVALSAEIPVLVARRALPRDTKPQIADFELTKRTVPGLSNRYIGDAQQLAGRKLRRPLNIGEALSTDALVMAPVIRRGQQVTVLARAGAMEIRMNAMALTDGRPSERISVRNLSTNRVIEGVVAGDALVEVPL